MTRKTGMMSYEKFKKAILNLHSANFLEHIHLGGFGEPCLHPHLIKMIKFVKENTDFEVSLTTNASKLNNPNYVKDLFNTKVDQVIISLRNTVPDIINKTLPSNLSYDEYVSSILRFIETKQKFNYRTKIDLALLKDSFYSRYILNVKEKFYIDNNYLNDFMSRLSAVLKIRLPSYDELTKSLSCKLSRIDTVNIAKGINLRLDSLGSWTTAIEKYKNPESTHLAYYGSCLGMKSHFSIYWNGDVSTCCADFDVKNRLGNIFEEKDIINILSNKRALFFAQNLKKNRMPSRTCQICRGGKNIIEKWTNVLYTLYVSRNNAIIKIGALANKDLKR